MGACLRPLKELVPAMLSAFRKRDSRKLRKINDQILQSAALDFDPVSFNMAIYSYVLSKIVSKPRYLRPEFEGSLNQIERALDRIVKNLERLPEEELNTLFSQLNRQISSLEGRDPRFVVDLMTKGKLKMAAILYAQGMSLGLSSEMTGMEKQEILDYAGSTMMFDRLKEERTIKERMKFARRLISE